MHRLKSAIVTSFAIAALACGPERSGEARSARADTTAGRTDQADQRSAVVAQVLRDGAVGTYLRESIAERDPVAAVRWDTDRHARLTVFVPGTVEVEGFTNGFRTAVRNAFAQWQTSGLSVRFDLTADSAQALVHLQWIEQFQGDRTGEAFVRWVLPSGWIQSGTLTLATHTPDGLALTREEVYAVALHEIGHLLGLGHSPDMSDVMHPVTRARGLSLRDRRTAQLLYTIPPGEVDLP